MQPLPDATLLTGAEVRLLEIPHYASPTSSVREMERYKEANLPFFQPNRYHLNTPNPPPVRTPVATAPILPIKHMIRTNGEDDLLKKLTTVVSAVLGGALTHF